MYNFLRATIALRWSQFKDSLKLKTTDLVNVRIAIMVITTMLAMAMPRHNWRHRFR